MQHWAEALVDTTGLRQILRSSRIDQACPTFLLLRQWFPETCAGMSPGAGSSARHECPRHLMPKTCNTEGPKIQGLVGGVSRQSSFCMRLAACALYQRSPIRCRPELSEYRLTHRLAERILLL